MLISCSCERSLTSAAQDLPPKQLQKSPPRMPQITTGPCYYRTEKIRDRLRSIGINHQRSHAIQHGPCHFLRSFAPGVCRHQVQTPPSMTLASWTNCQYLSLRNPRVLAILDLEQFRYAPRSNVSTCSSQGKVCALSALASMIQRPGRQLCLSTDDLHELR